VIHDYTVLTILKCLYNYRYPIHSHFKSKSLMQCCGSGSAWIHINFGLLDPDPGGQKMTTKSEEILSFEVLDDIFCGSDRMFLSLPDQDPLVRCTDLAPNPSISKQKQ
jgi:hypothetical protein